MKRGVTSLGATMEKVGPEILYITMVDMLEPLPSCSCAEGAPLRSVSSVGGENTREHSPEDSKRKPPAQKNKKEETENTVIGLEAQKFVHRERWQEAEG